METQLVKKYLSDINFDDTFFQSLKEDYAGFEPWIQRKIVEKRWAFVLEINSQVHGFLFLKSERNQIIDDVTPKLPMRKWLKIATFKINPHGTRLGERFLKKAFDTAIVNDFDAIYVTVFPKHKALIDLFKKYGFIEAGTKEASDHNELVLVKDLVEVKKDILLDYPKFNLLKNNKFLLAIYPQYHTRLFPDSILNNEDFDIIQDVSHTNSIEKVYICQMDCSKLKKDDIILIYRTKADDDKGKAHYRSVVTSVCTIEEIKTKQNFASLNDYLTYCENYSVFNRQELTDWYNKKGGLYIIKMVYNAALRKRVTRGNLIENVGLNSTDRWSIVSLENDQFDKIIKKGNVYESLIIN
jgi:hypothetical protein